MKKGLWFWMSLFLASVNLIYLQCISAQEASKSIVPSGFSGPKRTIPTDEAIRTLQTLEKRYRTVEFESRAYPVRVEDPARLSADLAKPMDSQIRSTTKAVIDYERGRWAIWTADTAWYHGEKCTIETIFAFDGQQYRSCKVPCAAKAHTRSGERVRLQLIRAYIAETAECAPHVHKDGFSLPFPPNEDYWDDSPPRPLSKWLAEKRDAGLLEPIVEEGGRTWRIRWRHLVRAFDTNKVLGEELVETVCDMSRGGAVREKNWYAVGNGKLTLWQVFHIELQQVGEFWVPQRWVRLNTTNRTSDAIEFVSVAINRPVPDETFQPEFPKGARVIDQVRKMTYVVGDRFEEREAVRRFMQEQGLAAPPEMARRWSWWWWVGGLGLLVILLGLLLAWRWRRQRFLGTSSTSAS